MCPSTEVCDGADNNCNGSVDEPGAKGCTWYYYDGDGDCPALRAQVVANHSRALPTLQLGNPAHPPMFFLHGWPDSAAVYANQFEHFCAPPHGTYFCVAPTWFDFHPDVPMRPADDLLWEVQVEAFHAVAVRTPLLFLAVRLPS